MLWKFPISTFFNLQLGILEASYLKNEDLFRNEILTVESWINVPSANRKFKLYKFKVFSWFNFTFFSILFCGTHCSAKGSIFRLLILPILLYGSECWFMIESMLRFAVFTIIVSVIPGGLKKRNMNSFAEFFWRIKCITTIFFTR